MPSNVRYINQFNAADFALNLWEENNRRKPTASYGCKLNEGTFHQSHITKPDRNLSFPENTYEIFAYAAQSHSNTLGAMGITRGCFVDNDAINLQKEPFNYKGTSRDHSAQFRAANPRNSNYWLATLEKIINRNENAKN